MAEQWPTQGKIDAGPVVQAIAAAKPDAILNVEFGPDLVKLVREGDTRGLFKDRSVVSFLTGEPEYLDPLKDEAPEGWIVTGYPWSAIHTPAHDAFLKAYQDRYHDHPRLGSVVGYALIEAVADILRKAELDRSRRGSWRRPRGSASTRPSVPATLPRARPPIDARRLRGHDGPPRRRGRDGGFPLRRRRRGTAARRRGEGAAPAGLTGRGARRSAPGATRCATVRPAGRLGRTDLPYRVGPT